MRPKVSCPTCGGPPRFVEGIQSARVVCAVCGANFLYTPSGEPDAAPRLGCWIGMIGAVFLVAGLLGTVLGLSAVLLESCLQGEPRAAWYVLLGSTVGMVVIGTMLLRATGPGGAAGGSGASFVLLAASSLIVLGCALGALVALARFPIRGIVR